MHRFWVAAAAVIALAAGSAQAQAYKPVPGVANTSWVEPNGDKVLQLSVEVPASAKDVWDAWTTSAGFASWAVPFARIDFGVGGMIEASYAISAKVGDPDNIKNQIVAYVPGRMMAIRNVQAPKGFVKPEIFAQTTTIIELAPVTPARTKVTLTAVGYKPGPEFDDVYRKFEWGDAYTLAELKKRFEVGPVDWVKAAQQAKTQAAVKTVEGTQP